MRGRHLEQTIGGEGTIRTNRELIGVKTVDTGHVPSPGHSSNSRDRSITQSLDVITPWESFEN